MPTNGRCEGLRAGALEDVVVLEVPAGGREAAILGLGGRPIVLLEHVVLELGSRKWRESQLAGRVDLIAEE
jgi:hypothetical protein